MLYIINVPKLIYDLKLNKVFSVDLGAGNLACVVCVA